MPPPEVTVERQVLAEPSARLTGRTWARLADGTPLVTQESARRRAHRAVPRHRQCRLVEPAAVGPVRGHAAAAGRAVGRRRGRRGRGAARRRSRRWTASAGSARRSPARSRIAAAHRRGDGELAAPSAGLVRHRRQAADAAQRRALNLGAGMPRAARRAAAARRARAAGASAACRRNATSGPGCWRWRCCCWWRTCSSRCCCAARSAGRAMLARAACAVALLLAVAAPAQAQPRRRGRGAARRGSPMSSPAMRRSTRSRAPGLVGLSDFVNRRTAAALAEPHGGDAGARRPVLLSRCSTGRCWPTRAQPDAAGGRGAERLHAQWRHHPVRHARRGLGRGLLARARARRCGASRATSSVPPLAPVADDHVLRARLLPAAGTSRPLHRRAGLGGARPGPRE